MSSTERCDSNLCLPPLFDLPGYLLFQPNSEEAALSQAWVWSPWPSTSLFPPNAPFPNPLHGSRNSVRFRAISHPPGHILSSEDPTRLGLQRTSKIDLSNPFLFILRSKKLFSITHTHPNKSEKERQTLKKKKDLS